ncbi:MAG: hypothetical protein SH808_03890 [Saprospiraceae bacterium]|nr:hypothetical protein [Saprospiraceae bacterium]
MFQDRIKLQDFSPHLFWDVAMSSLDIEQHAPYIIIRVISLGTMEDFKNIKS